MPQDERSSRFPPTEQRKAGASKLNDSPDMDAHVEVNIKHGRGTRQPTTPSPKSSDGAREDAAVDGSPEWLSTAASALPTAPRVLTSLFPRSSWPVLAFQYSLTEGGMALMAAFILLLISLAGAVTMYVIVPPRTSGVLRQLNAKFEANAEETVRELLSGVVPEALTLLQAGLQVMLIPAVLVGLGGILVLGSPDRRRPGGWLAGYGCASTLLGLALLYLLLRVAVDGQRTGLEDGVRDSLDDLWKAVGDEGLLCEWEDAFPCSGFDLCCVTNTTALPDEEAGLRVSAAWETLCFLTLPDGSAVTQDGENVTDRARVQCGDLNTVVGDGKEIAVGSTATACAVKSGTVLSGTSAPLSTCENYVVGHLASAAGFSLCLLLGMTVCSLVSGVVALISTFHRTRSADFVRVNNSVAAAESGESPMAAKGRK